MATSDIRVTGGNGPFAAEQKIKTNKLKKNLWQWTPRHFSGIWVVVRRASPLPSCSVWLFSSVSLSFSSSFPPLLRIPPFIFFVSIVFFFFCYCLFLRLFYSPLFFFMSFVFFFFLFFSFFFFIIFFISFSFPFIFIHLSIILEKKEKNHENK